MSCVCDNSCCQNNCSTECKCVQDAMEKLDKKIEAMEARLSAAEKRLMITHSMASRAESATEKF